MPINVLLQTYPMITQISLRFTGAKRISALWMTLRFTAQSGN
jgi:hypothetical protein